MDNIKKNINPILDFEKMKLYMIENIKNSKNVEELADFYGRTAAIIREFLRLNRLNKL